MILDHTSNVIVARDAHGRARGDLNGAVVDVRARALPDMGGNMYLRRASRSGALLYYVRILNPRHETILFRSTNELCHSSSRLAKPGRPRLVPVWLGFAPHARHFNFFFFFD